MPKVKVIRKRDGKKVGTFIRKKKRTIKRKRRLKRLPKRKNVA